MWVSCGLRRREAEGRLRGVFPEVFLRFMLPGANSTTMHWRLDGVSTIIPRFGWVEDSIYGGVEMIRGCI